MTRYSLNPLHHTSHLRYWFDDPINPRPTLREAIYARQPDYIFPTRTDDLPLWARAANRRRARRPLPITNRVHRRMIRGLT